MYGGFTEMLKERGSQGLYEYLSEKGIAYYEPCQVVDGIAEPLLDNEEFISLAKEGKLKIKCYTMYTDLYYGDTEKKVKDIKKNLDLAEKLGAEYYHQTLCPHERFGEDVPDYDTVNKKVFPLALDIAKYALSKGIKPIYEPQGMYYNGIDGLGKFISALTDELGEENVGVLFDMGNSLFVDVDPFSLLKEFAPRVKHVHLKNYRRVADGGYPSKAGARYIDSYLEEGVVPAEECVRYLEDMGYTGTYSSEVLVKGTEPRICGEVTFKWLDKILRKN